MCVYMVVKDGSLKREDSLCTSAKSWFQQTRFPPEDMEEEALRSQPGWGGRGAAQEEEKQEGHRLRGGVAREDEDLRNNWGARDFEEEEPRRLMNSRGSSSEDKDFTRRTGEDAGFISGETPESPFQAHLLRGYCCAVTLPWGCTYKTN